MTRVVTERPKFMQTCGLCGQNFQFGIGVYAGKHIARYNLTVCRGCWDANHDGWAPWFEAKLIAHLTAEGIQLPERNAIDLLPRG